MHLIIVKCGIVTNSRRMEKAQNYFPEDLGLELCTWVAGQFLVDTIVL